MFISSMNEKNGMQICNSYDKGVTPWLKYGLS